MWRMPDMPSLTEATTAAGLVIATLTAALGLQRRQAKNNAENAADKGSSTMLEKAIDERDKAFEDLKKAHDRRLEDVATISALTEKVANQIHEITDLNLVIKLKDSRIENQAKYIISIAPPQVAELVKQGLLTFENPPRTTP